MTARDRLYRNRRQAKLRIRAGLAAAALVGGGAIALTAVATGGHPAPTAAAPAAYAHRFASQGTMLSSALSAWSWSRQATYADLARLTAGYTQTPHQGQTLDLQRGIVVLATKKFLLIRSANGSLHLWLLSGRTRFQNVSASTSGTAALTASTSATQQAMTVGNMLPATTLLAGSPTTAAWMLTPTTAPVTVSVQVAGTDLTVTVTVTRSMATVSQTATMPATTMPAPAPVTFSQPAWQTANSLARGDLVLIAGTRAHGTLHAQLVLFSPLSSGDVGARTASPTPSPSPTHW
ncbi:MAG: hypothetical protein ACRDOB_01100 [Streptosporangiaceae bacterium]